MNLPEGYQVEEAPSEPNLPQGYQLEETPGHLETFGRAAANNFPLAPQAIASGEAFFGDKGYSQNLADWNAKAKEAKAAHPVTYGAGAVTGAAAPLLIPGVGEVMASAPLTSNALLGAAGAISNTDLAQNPKEALKQAAIGAGLGAATAGAVKAFTPEASTLENIASKEALKSTGVAPSLLGRLEPEEKQALGNFIKQNDLVNMDKEKALEKALEIEDQIGSKIGEIGKQSKDLGLVANPDNHLNAAIGLDQKARELSTLANPEARKLARAYAAGRDDVMGLGNQPGWDAIQGLKKQYGKIAFGPNGEIKNQANADTYFALSGMLKGIAKDAQSNAGLSSEYKDALQGYHQIQPVIKGLTKMAGRESAGSHGGHGLVGLIRSLPGQNNPAINIPTALALTAAGHPHLGIAASLPTILNPAVRSDVAQAAANNLPKIRQGMNQELIDFLSQRYGGAKGD